MTLVIEMKGTHLSMAEYLLRRHKGGRAGQVQRPFVMEAISSWQPFHLLAGDRTHYLWRLSSLSSGMKGAIAAENRGE